ncbi:MAG TPA: tetratricopeptide repeat protein [Thermoanaerobaculia bacterium]|jgi:tetratricopeptide (TPR) repeat protein|nr:tetratricopeptide repeat protein [Thermoanaerobaculia bacterium]
MAEHPHPDRATLVKFSGGGLGPEEAAWIEKHLRSGCAVCQKTVDDLLPSLDPPERAGLDWEDDDAWKPIVSYLEQCVSLIRLEREDASRLADELLGRMPWDLTPPGRYHTFGVCERLVERSFEAGFQDPARAVEIAELAIRLADGLDAEAYGPAVVYDLKARAWAYLGNARRISSDLTGAEQALAQAAALAEQGSADPLEEARILDLKASLLSDQGWFERAADLLDVVIDIYEEIREPHRKGRALISQALFLSYAGRPERTVVLIRQGLDLIDAGEEPRLVLMARHNLAWALNDCGRPEEARQHLESFRHTYGDFPDPWTALRLSWLEGRIAAGLGKPDEADRLLRDVRERFVEQALGYDASMVTLDLASLYLGEGRTAEVRQLAAEMLPIFLSQDVHRQALAALAAFQRAAETDLATPRLVQEIATYLRRARRNPRLAFRGSEG